MISIVANQISSSHSLSDHCDAVCRQLQLKEEQTGASQTLRRRKLTYLLLATKAMKTALRQLCCTQTWFGLMTQKYQSTSTSLRTHPCLGTRVEKSHLMHRITIMPGPALRPALRRYENRALNFFKILVLKLLLYYCFILFCLNPFPTLWLHLKFERKFYGIHIPCVLMFYKVLNLSQAIQQW